MICCLVVCVVVIFGFWLNVDISIDMIFVFVVFYGFFSGLVYSFMFVCVV